MPSNSSTSSSERWPKALLIAALAVAALRALELLALPINFFTFRSWEALVVRRGYFALPGPFYPDSRLDMVEEGDLAPHTPLAVKKRVLFITDRHGFRRRDSADDRWDVVIVGDSFTAGATLTQDDTLAERLEKRLGRRVYPLAPATLDYFMGSDRFVKNPPKVLVLELMETFIAAGVAADAAPFGRATSPTQKALQPLLKPFPRLAVLADRLDKGILYLNASAMVKRLLKRVPARETGERMLFRGDPGIPEHEVGTIVRRLKVYDGEIRKRGIRFIFLPVPDKETVYYDLIPGAEKPDGLAHLIRRLREEGVEAVDALSAFEAARREHPADLLYHTDDSHWNPRGVALAADLLARTLSPRP